MTRLHRRFDFEFDFEFEGGPSFARLAKGGALLSVVDYLGRSRLGRGNLAPVALVLAAVALA